VSKRRVAALALLILKDFKLLLRRPYDISIFVGVLTAYGVLGGRAVEPKLASSLGALTIAVIAALLLVQREEEKGMMSGLRLYAEYSTVFLAKLFVIMAVVLPLTLAVYTMSLTLSSYSEVNVAPILYLSAVVATITIMASLVALCSNISSVLLIGISTALSTPVLLDLMMSWEVDLGKALTFLVVLALGLLTANVVE